MVDDGIHVDLNPDGSATLDHVPKGCLVSPAARQLVADWLIALIPGAPGAPHHIVFSRRGNLHPCESILSKESGKQ